MHCILAPMKIIIAPIVCIAIAILFVSSLYVWELLDPKLTRLGRDHPAVIKRRFVSVTCSTIAAFLAQYAFTENLWIVEPTTPVDLLITITQTLLLMFGPLLVKVHQESTAMEKSLVQFRNIIFAPVMEELVFRQIFASILLHGGYSTGVTAFISPILFAVAHMHHYTKTHSPSTAFVMVLHTCVFGWLAFYFLFRRSVWDAILAHSICNWIGLRNSNNLTNRRHLIMAYIGGLVLFSVSIFIS